MTGLGFQNRCKIKKTDDFSSVFNFRKRISGTFIVLYYLPTTLGHARIGLIVGKKTARLAVRRNYMKRVLREFFRQNQQVFDGVDIILRVQKSFSRHEYREVRAELEGLFGRLQRRLQGGLK